MYVTEEVEKYSKEKCRGKRGNKRFLKVREQGKQQ